MGSLAFAWRREADISHQGQNLILNMNDKGFTVVAFNRTVSKVDHFLAHEAKGTPDLRHIE
jgi:6-phosphogluconate dehydrogenase